MGYVNKATAEKSQDLALREERKKGFIKELRDTAPAIEKLLDGKITTGRFIQIGVQSWKGVEKLDLCSSESVMACLVRCATLGLEPSNIDNFNNIFLIPRLNRGTGEYECTLMLGYQGMLELMNRSGMYDELAVHAVHSGDEFDYAYGTSAYLKHRPCDDPGELTHVYLIALIKGHKVPYINVMSKAQIDKRRERSSAFKYKKSTPWTTDYEAMALKTVIRASFNFLPKSAEVQAAVDADNTTPTMPVEYVVPEEA